MTCSTCKHWSPKKAGEMAKYRFAPCALGPNWAYKSPMHTCHKHRMQRRKSYRAGLHGLPSNHHPNGQRVGGEVMNCKPGDLAYVVPFGVETPGLVGRFVIVEERAVGDVWVEGCLYGECTA